MNTVYIVDSVRTAVGKAPRGSLRNMRPDDLGAAVVKGLLQRHPNLPLEQIEDLIMGCAFPEGEQGFNLGRIIAQRSGLPDEVPGMTVNRFCASGLQTIASAGQAIMTGQADLLLAGGVESMSMIPMGGNVISPNPDLMIDKPDVYSAMGLTAEHVADDYQISREDQDTYALRSHQRALSAIATGKFKSEIIPLELQTSRLREEEVETYSGIFDTDEGPRSDTSLEALSKLKPVFRADGTVTAGNSSQRSDGAAVTLMASETMVKNLNLKPMAKFLGYAVAGIKPAIMGVGPVLAIPKVLKQVGLNLGEIDLFELNEAFAAQSLAVMRVLQLDEDKVNVNGGAIALGHPLGCSGAKLTSTLLYEMARKGHRYGMVTLCVGGGMGVAGVFENVLR